MPRSQLTDDDRQRGRVLGLFIQHARGPRSAAEVARAADVSLDTLRKLEQGAVPTPGFFLVARIATELNLTLDDVATAALRSEEGKT